MIVVESIHQMLDVATIADSQPLPRTGSLRIIGNSDAIAVLAVNASEGEGLTLAGEPVTFARDATAAAYEVSVREAIDDASVGAVLAVHVPPLEGDGGEAVRTALAECTGQGVPIVLVTLGMPERLPGLPIFHDVEDAVRAMALLARHAEWRRRTALVAVDVDDLDVEDLGDDDLGDDDLEDAATLAADLLRMPIVEGPREAGLRVRLVDDPQFGPVVVVGPDDDVAEALDDRAYRLAPVTIATAGQMIDEVALAGSEETAASDARRSTGRVIAAVSRLPEVDGILAVEVRDLRRGPDGIPVARERTIVRGETSRPHDVAARRLDA